MIALIISNETGSYVIAIVFQRSVVPWPWLKAENEKRKTHCPIRASTSCMYSMLRRAMNSQPGL